MDFETDFRDAQIVRLEQNYRSTRGHPRRRVGGHRQQQEPQEEGALDRPARAAPRSGCSARSDELEEAEYITRIVRKAPRGRLQGADWRCSIAPTPSRAPLKIRCAPPASPTSILGGVGFYERREVKDALSYLKLILNPHDDIASAARHQRAGARHRQGRDGRARSRRCVAGRS